VLSTCASNGGYRENLSDVYNYDSSHNQTIYSEMKASTLEEHMKVISREVGLKPDTTIGMCTAAQMESVSIKELSYNEVSVTAIVTGGINVNGGRVGDEASWYEKGDKIISLIHGTINIILVIDAVLSEGVLAGALMTATEAKVAAIQELLLRSRYSMGIATGSGTDKIIIIANPTAKERQTDAGKHSKLGELIGKTVMAAVKEALDKQTNVNSVTQHSVLNRMERFGVTKESILDYLFLQEGYKDSMSSQQEGHKDGMSSQQEGHKDSMSSKQEGHKDGMNSQQEGHKDGINSQQEELNDHINKTQLIEELIDTIDKRSDLVTYTSLYAHLLDQFMWGLLKKEEVLEAAQKLLNLMDSRSSKVTYNFITVAKENEVLQLLLYQFKLKIVSIIDCDLALKSSGFAL